MTVRSLQVYGGQLSSDNTTRTLYTVPSGRTLIIRDVTVQCAGLSANAYWAVSIRVAGPSVLAIHSALSLAALGMSQRSGWWVLEEGDQLIHVSQSGSAQSVVASGSLLLGTAT